MNYEEKKSQLLKKSKKQTETINSILEQDSNLKKSIFQSKQKSDIQKLQTQSKKILEKLTRNEFEMAIVGLEKAGKSTLGNAIIKDNILPSARKRCTFTSTKLLKAKNIELAKVELYTKEEFQKEVFQKLLKNINYPNFENINYENLDLQEFNDWFAKLEEENENLFKVHSGKTDEEIRDILRYKNSLELTGDTKTFKEIRSSEFQEYIKGVDIGKDKEQTNTGKPRSVKNVEIYSNQLKDFENPILFDVPGFDSPTEIHEQETIKRLENADVIILVTNVGDKPNINSPQLNILRENTGKDGIPLKDKLFIFGNKFDTAGDLEGANSNRRTLISDVDTKYNLAKEEKVFVGSAKKYLDPKTKVLYEFDNSGIDNLKEALISYQQNELFNVIEKQISNLQKKVSAIFKEIKENISVPNNLSQRSLERKLEVDAHTKIRKNLEDNLNQIKVDLKSEFEENRYFSDGFKNQVLNYFQEISMSKIDELVPKYEDNYDSINRTIREKYLHNQFLDDFSNLVSEIVDDKADEVKDRVLTAFVSAIKDNSKVRERAKTVFKFEQQSGKFDYLFERFGRKMLDLIIYNIVMSSKRENDYKIYKDEFLYLDSRYKNDGRILNMVVSGLDEPITKIGLIDFKKKFGEILQKLSNNPKEFIIDCQDILFPQLENLISNDTTFDDSELFKNRKGCHSREDVLNEINRDIQNFKKVLVEAVIPILDLETVFIKRVEKEIRVLIASLDSEKIQDFILNSLDDYLEKEFANLDKKLLEYKSKKAILDKINKFLEM